MPIFKSAVTFCVLLLLMLVFNVAAIGQSEESNFEVGGQFSVLGRGTGSDATSIGGGARLTFNLTRYLALEGELNYFPSAGFNSLRRFQGQFGVKSGLRFDRIGVFGKVGPGFMDIKSRFLTCLPCPPGSACPAFCIPFEFSDADTRLSLDVGGVVEFYPARRITVRFDVGDTIVNRREPLIFFPSGSFATHNLQLGAGVGIRF